MEQPNLMQNILAHEINANVKSYKKVKKSDILAANTIVFGGSVFVSKLSILKNSQEISTLVKTKKHLFICSWFN